MSVDFTKADQRAKKLTQKDPENVETYMLEIEAHLKEARRQFLVLFEDQSGLFQAMRKDQFILPIL